MSGVCRWCKGTKHVQLLTSVVPCLECADTAEIPASVVRPTAALKRWLTASIGKPTYSGNRATWDLPKNQHSCALRLMVGIGEEWDADSIAQAVQALSKYTQTPAAAITAEMIFLAKRTP